MVAEGPLSQARYDGETTQALPARPEVPAEVELRGGCRRLRVEPDLVDWATRGSSSTLPGMTDRKCLRWSSLGRLQQRLGAVEASAWPRLVSASTEN